MAKIENFELEITTLKRMRTVWVYLPDNYDEKGEGFPVIYMHDGQNLFFDRLTAFGTAWHVDSVLNEIYKNTGLSCIVVGVESNDKVRLSEYSPWGINPLAFAKKRSVAKDRANRGGEGVKYGEWFADVLKPYIDAHYNTDRQRMATAVAGSSMGGNDGIVFHLYGVQSTRLQSLRNAHGTKFAATRVYLRRRKGVGRGRRQRQQTHGDEFRQSLQQTCQAAHKLRVGDRQRTAALRNGMGNLFSPLCKAFFATLRRVPKKAVTFWGRVRSNRVQWGRAFYLQTESYIV